VARQTTPRGVAVLTGAGGMMGSAIARELSGRYHLVLNDRRDCLEPLLASLQGSGEAAAGGEAEAGGEVVPVVADVSPARGHRASRRDRPGALGADRRPGEHRRRPQPVAVTVSLGITPPQR
jgi:NAD(P)-dependent dehydrogenase (short-subunit alcohol dehydrogenase family)